MYFALKKALLSNKRKLKLVKLGGISVSMLTIR